MKFLKNNLACLKKYRPFLYSCLKDFIQNDDYELTDHQGWYNLKLPQGMLYDLNPKADLERSIKISKIQKPKILVFDGIGLGSNISEYYQQVRSFCDYFILIEKDPQIFLAALKISDWVPFLSSNEFEIFVNTPNHLMVPALRDYFLLNHRIVYSNRIEHFYSHQAMQNDGKYYVDFAESFKLAVSSLQSLYLAPAEDAFRGLMNVNQNLGDYHQYGMVDAFESKLKGKKAILVSSGPSLEQHLPYLKRHQHKFFIACCDSAFEILLNNNIMPQMVFCLERLKRQEELFSNIPQDNNVILVTLPTVFNSVLKKHPGPIVFASRGTAFGKWLWPESTYFDLGESVATMALRLLVYMGCQDVYLLGQDLAYDRISHSSHVIGVSEQTKFIESERRKTSLYCELMGN
ncbi:hypothetical protein BVY03_00075, partial [bacterium K02(2017)]